MNILMATWDGGGNIAPMLGAAQRLLSRGHRVRMMVDAVDIPDVEHAGAEARPWRRAPSRADRLPASDIIRDWEADDDLSGFMRLRDRIMCDPAHAYAADVLDELRAEPATVIVSSEMLFGVMMAAEAARLPLVLFCSNLSVFPIPGLPPMGSGLRPATNAEEQRRQAEIAAEFGRQIDLGLPAVNAARQALGLAPIASLSDQVRAADRILLATSPCFDFPASHLPPAMRYVGPLLAEPLWASKAAEPAVGGDPLVLVAFSSTFQDQAAAIARVCAAIGELPVQGIVTLGPALVEPGLALPANVTTVRSASHDRLMRQCAVVVTHAGHGTVLRALRWGVPLLCLPMGRDQHDNAARVEAHGAGLRLDRSASSRDIAAAIGKLLGDASFKAAARRLATGIADGHGTHDLVAEIEALAARP